jgi:signal transduction histidine kinase
MLRTEVSLRGTASDLAARWRHPQTTVRWRLTMLYGGLFLACGVALLAITYTLVDHASITAGPTHAIEIRVPAQLRQALISRAGHGAINFVVDRQRIADLHQLVIESGIALAIMAIVSTVLGWLVAGRVLAPLRTITATTQEISAANLHKRLALGGPRDELGQLADTIDGLLERLESAFDVQRRFVANASHELRTPLTMMRATLDVAIAKPEGVPPQTRALDADLRLDLDDADRLLESFLMLARAQHGELGEQSSVALKPIVTAALAARTDQIAAKQIEVHTAAQPIRVAGSETLLERMVENVIENAVRHNQPHGLIEVALALDGGKARLIVDSGGPVLDERAVAQLAQPFRRLTAERTDSQNGHGLGLSIVAGIAAAHGGTLELHARPQGGLRVQITLRGAALAQPVGVR